MSDSNIPTSNSWADLDDEEDGKVTFKGLNPSANSFNPSSSSSSSTQQQQQQEQQQSEYTFISCRDSMCKREGRAFIHAYAGGRSLLPSRTIHGYKD
ncbi:hypothetical protein I203_103129 [Kwoniella mangroviensis CBS 8507]|uniref:uncharacterized protein n=1 Tax=Kwoniella mangroviensis CBS 8507 TaxID=1296122 RepID=UPI003049160B